MIGEGLHSRKDNFIEEQAMTDLSVMDKDLLAQLRGSGLTTAHILYCMPDHPHLLQTFIWQDYDEAPRFPILNKFLSFWQREIEGRLFSVAVAHSRLIKPAELKPVAGMWALN